MKKLFSVAEYLMVIVTIIKCFLEKNSLEILLYLTILSNLIDFKILITQMI